MPLTTTFNSRVKASAASGQTSIVITIKPAKHMEAFKRHRLALTPLPLRLVRVRMPAGEIEILATNLMNETDYPSATFSDRYCRRY